MQRAGFDGPGLAASLLSVVVWQTGLILQKTLTDTMNAGSLMLVQVGCAAALMWAWLLLRGQMPRPGLQSGLNVAWGMMAPGLVLGLGIAGAARTDGVSIALIWGLLPLLGPLLARLILREPLHWTFPAGGLIGLAGLLLMLSARSGAGGEGGGPDWAGNAFVLGAVICSSFSAVIGRVMNRSRDGWLQAATLQLSGGVISGVVIVALTGWTPPVVADRGSVLTLLYLILVMTIVNYAAFNFSLSRLTVSWVGLTAATSPVAGIAAAWLLLGARLGATDLVATGIIIAGVALPHGWRLLAAAEARRGPA